MKRLLSHRLRAAFFGAAALFAAVPAFAQSLSSYAPVQRQTSVAYSSISSTGTTPTGWRSTGTDDNRSTSQPIGFTFIYNGRSYTTFSMSTNGYMDLAPSTATGNGSARYGRENAQFSAVDGTLLALAPLYDDLDVEVGGTLAANFKYQTSGAEGSRVLTVEWIDLRPFDATGSDINMQVKLYEGTGVIEYRYGAMATGQISWTYTMGINAASMSASPLTSELLTQQTPNSGAFSSNPVNTLTVVPAPNSKYTFTPPSTPPAPPTNFAASNIFQSDLTTSWTDSSTNEVGFTLLRSPDGVNYVIIANITSTTSAATGAAYSFAQSGLAPGTTYFYRVTANNEGAASAPLSGSAATNAPGVLSSVASGNWSDTATWGGTVPAAFDVVSIANGTTVTIDTPGFCYDLQIGGATAGTLRFEITTARTLTVLNDVTIAANGAFRSAATGNQTGHVLQVGGDLVNDGTLDFSTSLANSAGAGITFTGSADNVFSGAGPTTDLRTLFLNKGTNAVAVLEVRPANLTIRGIATDSPSSAFLTLQNGTLKIAGTFAGTHRTFTSASYTLGANTGFWLANPNFVVAAQAGTPTILGTLRVSSGTFNVGTNASHALTCGTGGGVVVEGGAVNVTGRFGVSAVGTPMRYTQSGGTVTPNTAGPNTSTSLAGFDLGTSASSAIAISGGVILITKTSTAASGPRDYRNNAGMQIMSGGTLQLGNATTGAATNFRLQGTMPDLLLTNTSAAHTATLLASSTLQSALLSPGTTFNLNGAKLQVKGASFTNEGVVNLGSTASALTFLGAVPQTLGGAGSFPGLLATFELNNAAGLTIANTIAGNLATTRVNLTRGLLTQSGRLTIGSGGTSSASTQIGGTGVSTGGGSFDASPVYNLGTGGYALTYAAEGLPRVSGFEWSPARTVTTLTISNSSGVTITGGDVTVTTSLTLTSGIFHTSTGNVLTLASSVVAPPNGSTNNHIDGPLAIEMSTTTATNRTFAIGRAGSFRPLMLKSVNTGGVLRKYTAEVVASAPGGTPVEPLFSLDPVRYWRVQNTAVLNATARVNLAFGADDNISQLSTARVAQSSASNGTYTGIGGLAVGSPTSGTVESTTNLTPGSDFFTIALESPSFTWDGGAGTTNWSDAANWNPNGVPAATSNVTLSRQSATTIDVNGAYAVNDLTIQTNIVLNLNATSLTVNGAYNQSSSAVHLGTGTLELRGAFTVSGGTWAAESGTTLFSGTLAQTIPAGVTYHNLTLRGGGFGFPKTLAAGATFNVTGNAVVDSVTQVGLSAAVVTTMNVAGNFAWVALPGGANLSSLTVNLTGAGKTIASAPSTLEMDVAVAAAASSTLLDSITMVAGRTLTVNGRLNCGVFTIGGAGSLTVGGTSGVLGTATAASTGLDATVVATGSRIYNDGAIVEYNAAGAQTIHASAHPPTAMLVVAGSGVKTLDADLTLSGDSGAALTKGALVVAAGSTFADGGHRLTFTTPNFANVLVDGVFLSTGSGALSYEAGPDLSNIRAVDGTVFGDLFLNFAASTSAVELNSSGPVNLTFRNITFGGTAGTGLAGGTLRLSETGLSNVTVTGDVRLEPVTTSSTGGGFGGTLFAESRVTLLGNLLSTSVAGTQPIFNSVGTNTFVFGGAVPQTVSLATTSTLFTGATLRVDNPSGVLLSGAGLLYRIGGVLELAQGNVTTGSNTLAMTGSGTVSRTSGHIVGTLRKNVAAGASVLRTFEIGTGANYTPVDVTFASVGTAGNLAATTAAADHPNLATSDLDAAQTANRTWSLVNGGIAFTTADVTLHYVAADVDPGANPLAFLVRKYDAPNWSSPTTGALTMTSAQALGIASFSDFAVGEVVAPEPVITATAGTGGSMTPVGAVVVPSGTDQEFTITPDACHVIADVLVNGASVGAISSYTFVNVTANHTLDASFALVTHVITASAGAGGTIAPSGAVNVNCGTNQSFTVTPTLNFEIVDVLVDGNSVGAVANYEFASVAANHTIAATFALSFAGPTAAPEISLAEAAAARLLGSDRVLGVFPNPSSAGATRVLYRTKEGGALRLAVYDAAGRLVRTLTDGDALPGARLADWDGRDGNGAPAAAGTYFVRLTDPSGLSTTTRLVLLR